MSKRLKTTVLFLVLLSQLALPAGGAQVSALNDAEKKEFAQNVALPSPAEMFLAINRLGDTDWGEVADFDKRYDYQDNYLRALNLGVRSANGLVAILAEDKNKLGDVIVIVITLAEELMVQETILDRSKTFEDLANQGRWDELRDELDALRYLIEMEMDQLGDQDVGHAGADRRLARRAAHHVPPAAGGALSRTFHLAALSAQSRGLFPA